MTGVQVPCPDENDQILRAIVASRVRPLVRRMHLSPDWIIGLVGDRGSSKSLGMGNISIRDFAMSGAVMRSNAKIKQTVEVDDEIAAQGVDIKGHHYTAKGGSVVYEAEQLDRHALNRLDSSFEYNVICIDEINLFGSDSWRAMSNESLDRSDLVQQLRKFHCGLIYTCIDEMFVINRIRDATDVFIKCADTASFSYNLERKKPQGHDFEWTIYANSWRLAGAENTYRKTGRALCKFPINLRSSWGIVDTDERQTRKLQKELAPVDVSEDAQIAALRQQWGWLEDKVLSWKRAGRSYIESNELPGCVGRPLTPAIKQALKMFGVWWDNDSQAYVLNDFNLSDPLPSQPVTQYNSD